VRLPCSAHLAFLRYEYALDFEMAQMRHAEWRVQSMVADLVGICFQSSDGIALDNVLNFPTC
jgi:hypothetical protein